MEESNDIEEYNYSWSRVLPSGEIPPSRGGLCAILGDNQIITFGGHYYKGNDKFEYLNDVNVLDLETMSWIKVNCTGDIPSPRYGHSGQLVGSKLFVFGGKGKDQIEEDSNHTTNVFSDIYFLDLLEWNWVSITATSAGPSPRLGHASSLVGRKMVIHGGWDGIDEVYDDLWVFDTETFTWMQPRTAGISPSPRYGHTLNLTMDGRLILFGGTSFTDGGFPQYHNDIRELDTETMKWRRSTFTGMNPTARQGHTAISMGRMILLFGGWGRCGLQCEDNPNIEANSIVLLDTETMNWIVPEGPSHLPPHRYGHSCILVDNALVVIGGWNGKQALAEVSLIEFQI